jgi:acyl-CoA synthetase
VVASVQGCIVCVSAAGDEVWRADAGGSVFSSPSLCGPLVVVGSHGAATVALAAATGSLVWRHSADAPVFASPFCCTLRYFSPAGCTGDHAVVTASADGVVSLLRASDCGQTLASITLPGAVFSSPVLVGAAVYVGCRDNHLYCLDIEG